MIAGLPITHSVTIDELKMEIDVAMKLTVLEWQLTLGSVTPTDRRIAAGWVGDQQAVLEDPLVWEANGANPFTVRSEGIIREHALSVLRGSVVCVTSYVDNAQYSLANNHDQRNIEWVFVFVNSVLIAVQVLTECVSGAYQRRIVISDREYGLYPGWKQLQPGLFQHETGAILEYIEPEDDGSQSVHR
jgi:hypothetical protein